MHSKGQSTWQKENYSLGSQGFRSHSQTPEWPCWGPCPATGTFSKEFQPPLVLRPAGTEAGHAEDGHTQEYRQEISGRQCCVGHTLIPSHRGPISGCPCSWLGGPHQQKKAAFSARQEILLPSARHLEEGWCVPGLWGAHGPGYMGRAAATWVPMGGSVPVVTPNDDPNPSQSCRKVSRKVTEQPKNCISAQSTHRPNPKPPQWGIRKTFSAEIRKIPEKIRDFGVKKWGGPIFRIADPPPPPPPPPQKQRYPATGRGGGGSKRLRDQKSEISLGYHFVSQNDDFTLG